MRPRLEIDPGQQLPIADGGAEPHPAVRARQPDAVQSAAARPGSNYVAATGNGQNATYAIVGFVGVTITQAAGSGSNMNISIQPSAIVDPTAVFSNLAGAGDPADPVRHFADDVRLGQIYAVKAALSARVGLFTPRSRGIDLRVCFRSGVIPPAPWTGLQRFPDLQFAAHGCSPLVVAALLAIHCPFVLPVPAVRHPSYWVSGSISSVRNMVASSEPSLSIATR